MKKNTYALILSVLLFHSCNQYSQTPTISSNSSEVVSDTTNTQSASPSIKSSTDIFAKAAFLKPQPNSSYKNKPIPLFDMETGPIETFEDACSRCHGPYGTFYGDEFAHLPDAELKDVTWDMMEGPGNLDTTEPEVDAMTEYHHALREKSLFVTFNNAAAFNRGEAKELTGDVTPGAVVDIRKDDTLHSAKVNEYNWTLDSPPPPPFTVIARKDGQEVLFDFPQAQWNDVK